MTGDILSQMSVRRGHFLLESGFHANLWFNLDSLFISPRDTASLINALAHRLVRHSTTAICGPIFGGAFLAQAIATELDLRFYYTLPTGVPNTDKLFSARYDLPPELKRRAQGERFAIVDDVISAGSSVRATANALDDAGGVVVVLGTLALLGTKASDYFANRGIEIEALTQREFVTWPTAECPMCARGETLINPDSETLGTERNI